MRFIEYYGDAGRPGTSYSELYVYEDDNITTKYLDKIAHDYALDNVDFHDTLDNIVRNKKQRKETYDIAVANSGWRSMGAMEFSIKLEDAGLTFAEVFSPKGK